MPNITVGLSGSGIFEEYTLAKIWAGSNTSQFELTAVRLLLGQSGT
jgi:hypothetical protein